MPDVETLRLLFRIDDSAFARTRANAAQTSRAIQGETASMSRGVSSHFSTMAKGLATAFAVTEVVKFGREAVHAAEAGQVATLKLANSVEHNRRIGVGAVETFSKQAEAIGRVTGASHLQIEAGQALAASYNLSGDQITKLTPLVTDLALKTGKDLPTSFRLVAKAAAGDGAAGLIKFGVHVDKAKYALDPFGATMDAVTHKAGGFGVAYGQTAAGGAARFRESMDTLREHIGTALLPTLQSLANVAVNDLIPAFDKVAGFALQLQRDFNGLPGPIKVVIEAMAGAAAGALVVSKASGFVSEAWTGLKEAGSAAASIYQGVEGVVKSAGAAYNLLTTGEIRATVAQKAQNIGAAIGATTNKALGVAAGEAAVAEGELGAAAVLSKDKIVASAATEVAATEGVTAAAGTAAVATTGVGAAAAGAATRFGGLLALVGKLGVAAAVLEAVNVGQHQISNLRSKNFSSPADPASMAVASAFHFVQSRFSGPPASVAASGLSAGAGGRQVAAERDLAAATTGASAAAKVHGAALIDEGASADTARRALKGMQDVVVGAQTADIGFARSQIALHTAQAKVNELQKAGKRGTDEYRLAVLDAQQAQLDMVAAQHKAVTADAQERNSLKQLQGGTVAYTAQAIARYHQEGRGVPATLFADFNKQALALLSAKDKTFAQKEELKKLYAQAGVKMPNAVRDGLLGIEDSARRARAATDAARAGLDAFNKITGGSLYNSKSPSLHIGPHGQGAAGGKEKGKGGGWTWTGERGPELVNLDPDSVVIPSHKSMDLVRQGVFPHWSSPGVRAAAFGQGDLSKVNIAVKKIVGDKGDIGAPDISGLNHLQSFLAQGPLAVVNKFLSAAGVTGPRVDVGRIYGGNKDKLVSDTKGVLDRLLPTIARAISEATAAATGGLSGPIGTFTGKIGDLVAYGKRFLGIPYSWGGGTDAGPSFGFAQGAGIRGYDCSSFTKALFSHFGVHLPRVAADQQRALAPDSGHPGNLVFFGKPAHHVGVYLGGGRMQDSPHTGAVNRYDPLFSGFSGFGRVPGFWNGGIVGKTGIIRAEQGEGVIPTRVMDAVRHESRKLTPAAAQSQTINLVVDGRVLARVVNEVNIRAAR